MVARPLPDSRADLLFHALADATRRDIVRRAMGEPRSISWLAAHYPMSFAAVQKHVAVLGKAGLVTKKRRGREALIRTDMRRVRDAARLLDEFEALWRSRIDRMDDLLAELDPNPPAEGAS